MREPATDLVCVSHLFWDWVWQRPQHLMSRLARDMRVLYVEEPRIQIGAEHEAFEIVPVAPGVEVARLVLRGDRARFWERLDATREARGGQAFAVSPDITEASLMFVSDEQPRLEREARELVAGRRRGPLVLWLYTPLVVGFMDLLQADLVVYDAMDELTAFKFAPARMRDQEQELLRRADLVFAGGPSLHESKRRYRDDVHLFPSGVDEAHFAQAREPGPVPAELEGLPRPVVGYYGVVDERIDYELLSEAARLRPDWSWVMVGPRLKVEEASLPALPNLRYLGKQRYEDLPAVLRAFDVAMMPFAMNEATRFISPTKTLEYLAGGRPVVSTPIRDVISLYGSVVRVAADAATFVAEAEAALAEGGSERSERDARASALLAEHAWDRIAERMSLLIRDGLRAKGTVGGH